MSWRGEMCKLCAAGSAVDRDGEHWKMGPHDGVYVKCTADADAYIANLHATLARKSTVGVTPQVYVNMMRANQVIERLENTINRKDAANLKRQQLIHSLTAKLDDLREGRGDVERSANTSQADTLGIIIQQQATIDRLSKELKQSREVEEIVHERNVARTATVMEQGRHILKLTRQLEESQAETQRLLTAIRHVASQGDRT